MNALVSIVVPVYNMGDSIIKSVESLLQQTYKNIEVILVDDGSKDNSYDNCCLLASRDSRVSVIQTENCGSGPARNTGIKKAKGKYIYFPDADDYLEPDAISTCVKTMNDSNSDLVVFGFKNVNPKGKTLKFKKYTNRVVESDVLRKDYSECIGYMGKWGIQGAPWNKFFSLETIKSNGVEFPPLRRHQDEGFICRYMCFCRKVHFIPYVFYTYYTNDLKKEWEKYPLNYIDSVVGLCKIRKETILSWNPSDLETHQMIQKEYISNFIKALELSFSPKMKFDKKQRILWLREQITRFQFDKVETPKTLGRYQKHILSTIKNGKMHKLYRELKLKVCVQQSILFRLIKR